MRLGLYCAAYFFFSLLVPASEVNADGLDSSISTINIHVFEYGETNKTINGAKVTIEKDGKQLAENYSNDHGKAILKGSFVDDKTIEVVITKPGYFELRLFCPCDGRNYAISSHLTDMNNIGISAIWASYWVGELLPHLVFSGNHIYQGNDYAEKVQYIRSPGHRPKSGVIHIITVQKNKRYIYALENYLYINDPKSNNLSESKAQVYVRIAKTLLRTYDVPNNVKGNLWIVFAITENGDIQDINKIIGVNEDFSFEKLQSKNFLRKILDNKEVIQNSVLVKHNKSNIYRDLRYCLDSKTNDEIIKCTEK